MKKFFLHIFLVSILGMLTVSCNDTEMVEYLDTNTTQVMFSIAMDTPMARTRATWGDNYNENLPKDENGDEIIDPVGDAYDNRIDVDQLIVKIVDGDVEYKVTDIFKWNVSDGENEIINEYKFVGIVESKIQGETLTDPKVYVYANMGKGSEPAEKFNQNAEYIPMWGVKTIEGEVKFTPGTRVDLEQISLLRAMAKLEVSLNEEMSGEYGLFEATLNKHNYTGYTSPTITEGFDGNTESLDLEGVLNVIEDDPQESLTLVTATDKKSCVVYLPEVENEELQITVKLKKKLGVNDAGEVIYDEDEVEGTFSLLSNVVRNHWYKYTIKGFAASNVLVSYNTVPWTDVNINIGGEGFLYLSKDVVEMYNSNVDADQLKFYSSSPIKSIVLADSYKHYRNGDIKETPVDDDPDNVYAYYMNKSGVLVQLSEADEKEAVVLSKISAVVKEEHITETSGDIIINSPFMADKNASESALQSDSHYNTIRYLEFVVTNEQGLTATFRVMQYPPVVITNEEGFFSYRDDHMITDNDPVAHYLNIQGQHSLFITGIEPYHEHDWSDEVNQSADWHTLPIYQRDYSWAGPSCPDDKHKHDWEEMRYGMGKNPVTFTNSSGKTLSGYYSGGYRTVDGPAPTDYFLRNRYHGLPGVTESSNDDKGLAIGNPFVGEDGKTYRRHYTWDLQVVFWQKAVMEVLTEDKTYSTPVLGTPYICETCTRNKSYNKNPFREYILVEDCEYYSRGDNNSHKKNYKWTRTKTFKVGETTKTLPKGSAAINVIAPNSAATGWTKYSNLVWTIPVMNSAGTGYNWGSTRETDPAPGYSNHRMYQIKTTVSNGQNVIGVPTIVDDNGHKLDYLDVDDAKIGVTENSPANANKISPFLAVASELGETSYASVVRNAISVGYTVPNVKKLYAFAERHCREYVETTYNDKNNNYMRDEDEPVVHYHDWRLPTKAEIEMIIAYQENSPAMDRLLTGQHYYCVTGNGNSDDISNIYNWVSSEVPNYKSGWTGYYIRCVRDVKPEGKNGTIDKKNITD